jgi:hypothetical protein
MFINYSKKKEIDKYYKQNINKEDFCNMETPQRINHINY